MGVHTPWGQSQGKAEKFIRGVNAYSTAGHGGVCVSKGLAEKRMSDYALNKAIKTKRGYWLEEDVDISFVFYEIPEALEAYNNRPHMTKKWTKEDFLKDILHWYPDYTFTRKADKGA
jgi:hypothetical protein